MSEEQSDEPIEDEPASADGVEQLQQAALDALAAARSMIEAAESVVRQPGAIESFVHTLSDLARTGTQAVSNMVADATKAAEGTGSHRRAADVDDPGDVFDPRGDDVPDDSDGADDSDDDDGRFETIELR